MGTRRTKPTKAASRQQPRALVVQNRYPTAISKPMEDAHHTVSHRHNEHHHHHLRRQHMNTTRHAISHNNRELQPFRFLDLPKDIRLLIYENLPKKTTHQLCTPDSVIAISDHTFPPAILSTCRLIYAEASPFLFNAIRHDGPRLAVAFQGLRIDRLLDVLCVLAPNTARLKWEKRGEHREYEQHERRQREQYYHHHQQRHCSTSSTSSTSSSFSSYPSTPTSPTTPTSRTPPVNLASMPLRPQNFDLRCYMRTPKDHPVHINWAPNPTMSSQLTEQQFLARFVKDLGRFYCLVSNYGWTVSLQVGVGACAGDGGGGDGEYDQLVPLETFLRSRITGVGEEFQERLIADGLVTWLDILNRGGRVRHVSRWLWNRM